MEIIAHRGNLFGPDPRTENTPTVFDICAKQFIPIELDLWYYREDFWFGHDEPTTVTNLDYLIDLSIRSRIYVHLKSIRTAEMFLMEIKGLRRNELVPFYHNVDECVLLPRINKLWVHPDHLNKCIDPSNSIIVVPQLHNWEYYDKSSFAKFHGICTDYPLVLMREFKNE